MYIDNAKGFLFCLLCTVLQCAFHPHALPKRCAAEDTHLQMAEDTHLRRKILTHDGMPMQPFLRATFRWKDSSFCVVTTVLKNIDDIFQQNWNAN